MDDKEFVYEDAVSELEGIVNSLNNGNVSLDESIRLYTRGVELVSKCNRKISEVEQKIAMIDRESQSEIPYEDKGE